MNSGSIINKQNSTKKSSTTHTDDAQYYSRMRRERPRVRPHKAQEIPLDAAVLLGIPTFKPKVRLKL